MPTFATHQLLAMLLRWASNTVSQSGGLSEDKYRVRAEEILRAITSPLDPLKWDMKIFLDDGMALRWLRPVCGGNLTTYAVHEVGWLDTICNGVAFRVWSGWLVGANVRPKVG